ncbi:hypothetical protein ACFQUU_21205 [Herbaspirillum sp. GCM10030257]|uniref:hypothetical protein n=1 Tax=Herbaspirillum sp. GCM10030257 TaxID=3273393 RepID=UPI00360B6256
MELNFSPQFHKKISYKDGRAIWVATPHPATLIPMKTRYYQAWQREERLRLQDYGDEVMTLAMSV